ncbi:SERTA domain-containing protein 3 [Austrofundulus limnaeus]|uniref:SERTA domain-containing protein 2-like n=1 Tax=Austrofundulus limnaeus TaxID=52670 RepID=A0A2I4BUL4_AUSLI|nr:PREDICTED: SERTA domain-containing protein 2-like [Austrofundulus limnaeus]XP_013871409.1 PREDICTED: SERTA domain-containing protein 2-like [Austrofundulus limnaeus]
MILKGQKRKHPHEDVVVLDQSGPLWESQRQFVFSVSLNKYQRTQELAEPSLRRSVLIANTLRQISLDTSTAPPLDEEESLPPCGSSLVPEEMEGDGVSAGAKHQSAVSMHCGCPVVSLNCLQICAASRSCHVSDSDVPATAAEEDEDWGSMSTESDLSLSAAISSILTALDSTVDGDPQAALRTPLRSLENLSGACKGGVALASISWDQQGESKVPEGGTEVTRTQHMDDVTMEDLFQDIDTSQLERDMGVLGLQSGAGLSRADEFIRYIPPLSQSASSSFSFSLNSNLKGLPSFSSFSPLSSTASPSSPGSASFSGPGQAREGLELEQLMEILVES